MKARSARRSYGAVFQTDVGFRVIGVKAQENNVGTGFAGDEAATILSLILCLILN
jgi:phosphomannomutase